MSLVEKLKDLIIQATHERSHYYVRSVCVESINEIERLQKDNEQMKEVLTELRYGIFHHSHVSKLAEDCLAKLGER